MEKRLNAILTISCITLVIFLYLPFSYAPNTSAQSIGNGSAIINGSVDGIPAGKEVTLFILDNGIPLTDPLTLSSSNNIFSVQADVNEGDVLSFMIDGKDTGVTVTYHVGDPVDVLLHYSPPGNGDIIITHPTEEPPKSVPSPTVTATPPPISVTPTPAPPAPSIIAPTPTVTATAPVPSPEPPTIYPLVFAAFVGIAILAGLISLLKRL